MYKKDVERKLARQDGGSDLLAQAKKSSIDGYTIEMAPRTHTLTHNKRRGEEEEEEGADIFLGREDRWMEGRRADGQAEKRGIMSWRCTKARWKIDRTRFTLAHEILLRSFFSPSIFYYSF
jgi:hypothetical protein